AGGAGRGGASGGTPSHAGGGTATVAAGAGGASSGGLGGASGGGANGGRANGGASAAGSPSGGAGGSPFPPGVTKPRIMIVGDSISAGPGCYKKFLLKDLTDNHYSSFEFVGQYTDDCSGGTVRHSAVSCSTAEQFTQATFTMPNCSQGMSFPGMSTLVATHNPDLIMLQLGVNDVWNSKTVDAILGSYATLVQQARAHNPNVVLVVARIQKIRPDCSTDDKLTKLAESLVTAVPAWAQGQSQPTSPVFVADLWSNSDWSRAETIDCVHPNDVGAEKMGMNWYNALKSILKPD
ncbi:MAG TPA: GDSL-type esterase/lipase family protein, partial [Polyangiaceae bacterium]|nr:GDSL-type esterase/lipase family protein [Polyangiaceae bacterium]